MEMKPVTKHYVKKVILLAHVCWLFLIPSENDVYVTL